MDKDGFADYHCMMMINWLIDYVAKKRIMAIWLTSLTFLFGTI
jgi:hypothetical protein